MLKIKWSIVYVFKPLFNGPMSAICYNNAIHRSEVSCCKFWAFREIQTVAEIVTRLFISQGPCGRILPLWHHDTVTHQPNWCVKHQWAGCCSVWPFWEHYIVSHTCTLSSTSFITWGGCGRLWVWWEHHTDAHTHTLLFTGQGGGVVLASGHGRSIIHRLTHVHTYSQVRGDVVESWHGGSITHSLTHAHGVWQVMVGLVACGYGGSITPCLKHIHGYSQVRGCVSASAHSSLLTHWLTHVHGAQ